MAFKEILALHGDSENHMKHINRLCGQDAEFLKVKACDGPTYCNVDGYSVAR
jgi:glutamine amidotransferase PdxT